jgi:hypothetical protein
MDFIEYNAEQISSKGREPAMQLCSQQLQLQNPHGADATYKTRM